MTPDTLTRSRRLVEALVAVRPRFRPEWWNHTSVELGRTDDAYCGPDLLARENLADLFEVCDALFRRTQSFCHTRPIHSDEMHYRGRVEREDFNVYEGCASTRAEALMLAAEAALGIAEEGGAE